VSARLDALSPLAALRRGYAVALDQRQRVVRNISSVTPGDAIDLRVVDGSIGCRVERVEPVRD
jgi:exodeoxyribonuclease VII large subunit